MARVAALVQAGVSGQITTKKDAVRAFDVVAQRMALAPLPCGWRALFTASHAACQAGSNCKCHMTGATAFDPAREGPVIQEVRHLLSQRLAGEVKP